MYLFDLTKLIQEALFKVCTNKTIKIFDPN